MAPNYDLTSEAGVIALMENCKTAEDWASACKAVKAVYGGGYPGFWYSTIIQSGLCNRVSAAWGGSDRIGISEVR